MRCLDDCHNYYLGNFVSGELPEKIAFYRLALDGTTTSGTTNEEVIRVLIHRLHFLNEEWEDGKFRCKENSLAIIKLEEALEWLEKRTEGRIRRGVEGAHNG